MFQMIFSHLTMIVPVMLFITTVGTCQAEAQPTAPPAPPPAIGNTGSVPPDIAQAMQMPEGAERTTAISVAAKEWGHKEPVAALSWAMQLPAPLSGRVCMEVARINPQVSADWLIQQDKGGPLHPLLYYWATVDPVAAAAWCVKAPKKVRYLAFFSVGDGWVMKDPASAVIWAMKLESADDRLPAIHGVAMRWSRSGIPAVTTWIKQLKSEEAFVAAKAVADDWKFNTFNSGGTKNVAAITEWLGQLPLSKTEQEDILKGPPINVYKK